MESLPNETILFIFEFIPLSQLLELGDVCLQWLNLVQYFFKVKALKECNMNQWNIEMNFYKHKYTDKFLKLLDFSGKYLNGISFGSPYFKRPIKGLSSLFLPTIAKKCPNLNSITIWNLHHLRAEDFSHFASFCPDLTSFYIFLGDKNNCFTMDYLSGIFIECIKLEELGILSENFSQNFFTKLPNNLKKVFLKKASKSLVNSLTQEHFPSLQTLLLDASFHNHELEYLGVNCPNLAELSCFVPPLVNLSHFKNLKVFQVCDNYVDFKQLSATCPALEVLKCYIYTDKNENFLDFRLFQQIKVLYIENNPVNNLSVMKSLDTIRHCRKLEEFRFLGEAIFCENIIGIIESCTTLKFIDLPCIFSCRKELISAFVSAIEKSSIIKIKNSVGSYNQSQFVEFLQDNTGSFFTFLIGFDVNNGRMYKNYANLLDFANFCNFKIENL